MKVDCHVHLIKYDDPASYPWISGAYQFVGRDYLPDELAGELAKVGLEGCIAIEARQNLAENDFLLGLADQYPIVKGVVGWVDLCSANVAEQIERYIPHPRFVGVRHVLQAEADDRYMLREEFVRGVGVLGAYDLVYELLIMPRHLPYAIELVEMLPEVRFSLNHIGKPPVKERTMEPWRTDIEELALHPNVYCKVSDLISGADPANWKPGEFRPYLDVVFEAFGTDRTMIGSDWPPFMIGGPYEKIIGVTIEYIRQFSPEAQAGILGDNAQRCYRLPD